MNLIDKIIYNPEDVQGFYENKKEIIKSMLSQILYTLNIPWEYQYEVIDNQLKYETLILNKDHAINITANSLNHTFLLVGKYIDSWLMNKDFSDIQGFHYLKENFH